MVSGEFRYFGSVAASSARAPKAMTRPLGVDDGDGEPVAEAIVGRAAVVGLDQEAGVEELRLAESAFDECSFQRVLAARRKADAELFQRRSGEPAPLGIAQRLAAIARRSSSVLESRRRRLERIEQA